ncbi:putative ribosome-binding factor A, mitochondrial isoform X1 [Elephas maximus indicus]|uniref:putative ribosome-binding factor A, mitochondrial isoform X1 n=1 Tax=Elephas maximus indicus TaxID=99487 RepID=UPI002116AB93|nr:putative ribosome-binding factor A, mitochondrial isoform X1 [Elephas maximus indicus]
MWAPARGLWGPRAGLGVLLGGRGAGCSLLPGRPRGLQGSPVSCGSKNLLKKFASKTKKKFWYEGPSLGSHLKTYKPSKLELLTKNISKKTRKEDHVRLRALNGLLYKALRDLLSTSEVSQEVYDLNVELSKVSLTSDFSACRVYWRASLSAEQNEHTHAILQKSAGYMRHLLMSHQTLRNVPPIVFVQDRQDAALAEVDQLLAVADFGPPDGKEDLIQNDVREPPDQPPLSGAAGLAAYPHLFGIDHEALNKQIMEYKRRKEKGLGCASLGRSEQVREQLAELVRQTKRRKKKAKPPVHDISPKSFLLGGESEDSLDDDEDHVWLEEGTPECGGLEVETGNCKQGSGE